MKLTDDDIRMIVELKQERDRLREELRAVSERAIAEKFGVCQQVINRIPHRGTTSYVKG